MKYRTSIHCSDTVSASQNQNFGMQPEDLVASLPEFMQSSLQGILDKLPQQDDGKLAPWCTSVAGAWILTQLFEVVRLPGTVLLLPSIPYFTGAEAKSEETRSGAQDTAAVDTPKNGSAIADSAGAGDEDVRGD